MMIRTLLALLCCTALLACSVNVLPEKQPVDLYALPAATLEADTAVSVLDGLRLSEPATSNALAGSRLLVRMSDGSLQAFPAVQWEAQVPVLWRNWLLDAFWRDGRVSGLSTNAEGLQAQLELGGMLRAFNMAYQNDQLNAVIQYDVRLVELQSRRIVASRRFTVSEPAEGQGGEASVQAMGRAADRLAQELIDWAIMQSELL